jgi:hypothetical protein
VVPWIFIGSLLVIRLLVAFGDKFVGSPWKDQLVAQKQRPLIEETHSAINAKLAAVSWAPMAAAATLIRLPALCPSTFSTLAVPLLFAAVAFAFGVSRLPFKWFLGKIAPVIVVGVSLGLDIVVSLLPDVMVKHLCG